MEINFQNQYILITGATKGIGSATADLFDQAGGNLILTGVEDGLVESLNQSYKGSTRKYYFVDFTNRKSIDYFLQELDKYQRIDVCVNNAGINILDEFIDIKDEDFDTIMNINLKAPYIISKYVAKRMIDQKYGRIINIASIWSKITRPRRAVYTASKNAIYGLTQTMAIELAQYNILVNAVSPGFTLTELTKLTNTKDELEILSNQIPIKKMAMPIDIANVVFFLASQLNNYIIGQNIIVDGGYSNV